MWTDNRTGVLLTNSLNSELVHILGRWPPPPPPHPLIFCQTPTPSLVVCPLTCYTPSYSCSLVISLHTLFTCYSSLYPSQACNRGTTLRPVHTYRFSPHFYDRHLWSFNVMCEHRHRNTFNPFSNGKKNGLKNVMCEQGFTCSTVWMKPEPLKVCTQGRSFIFSPVDRLNSIFFSHRTNSHDPKAKDDIRQRKWWRGIATVDKSHYAA